MSQARIVEALKEHGALSIEELVELLPDTAFSTIKQQLSRLKRSGIIEGRYVYRLKEDSPWRYVCPKCGAYRCYIRANKRKHPLYYCPVCGHHFDEFHDRGNQC